MKACIFDLDGTLYQTEIIAVPSFEKAFQSLHKQGMIEESVPSEEKIHSCFGLTSKEFWAKLLPGSDEKIRRKADQLLLKYEKELIHQGKGKFYPGVVEGLKQLNDQGWMLFIVSNGIREYIHTVLDSADIKHLFTEIYALGDQSGMSKKDAVQQLIQKYSIQEGYFVGDRSSDVETGMENGLTVIACRYKGYPYFGEENELADADYIIHDFHQLLDIIKI